MKPVAFDIDIKDELPENFQSPVKARLEKNQKSPPSSEEEITKKLMDAEERRASIQSEKVAKASADVERAMHMREKIDNEVQESSAEIKVALEARLALAESNRVEQISKIQEKAANKVKQALFVYETVKEKEASEKQSKLESIDAKLANAEEKRNENISNIQGKASAEVAKALEIAAMPKDEKENEDIVMEPDFEIERD
eukprot:TRINITY_DN381_c0_g1_i1.p2 TRINITY_DN381_c0_g1~~TRINITY_DN381_c0_g1_i1.p2  ORF type:complete len:212 (+),score=109.21 TRINITY_DN381_c0_g1_i1:41-637(+)